MPGGGSRPRGVDVPVDHRASTRLVALKSPGPQRPAEKCRPRVLGLRSRRRYELFGDGILDWPPRREGRGAASILHLPRAGAGLQLAKITSNNPLTLLFILTMVLFFTYFAGLNNEWTALWPLALFANEGTVKWARDTSDSENAHAS